MVGLSNNMVLVGSGGEIPRVERLLPDSRSLRPVAQLTRGHSVYALVRDPFNDDAIVIGTKGGALYRMSVDMTGRKEQPIASACLDIGASVLTMCRVAPSWIAMADVRGHCLLWDGASDSSPMTLETGGRIVCSLLEFDETTLLGVTTCGSLLRWNTRELYLSGVASALQPPAPSAQVHMLAWGDRDVVYPAADGSLIVFQPATSEARHLAAHDGASLALVVIEDELISIGEKDGLLKRWSPDSSFPRMECHAPNGIVAAVVLGINPTRLLLVDNGGSAGVYELHEDELQFCYALAGGDFRRVVGPSWAQLKSDSLQRHAEEARQLVLHCQAELTPSSPEELEQAHARLRHLGYEHVSLALRADDALKANDFIGELKAYRDLLHRVPNERPEMRRAVNRYVDLLIQMWQLQAALDVVRTTSSHFRDAAALIERQTPFVDAMAKGSTVIEPDVPVESIVTAARVLRCPVSALLQIKRMSPLPIDGSGLDARRIHEKYEQIRQEPGFNDLGRSSVAHVDWLSRDEMKEVTVIRFANVDSGDAELIQFGLTVLDSTDQVIVVPVVMLDAKLASRDVGGAPDGEVIVDRIRINARLRRIHQAVGYVLRRMQSKMMAQRPGLEATVPCR